LLPFVLAALIALSSYLCVIGDWGWGLEVFGERLSASGNTMPSWHTGGNFFQKIFWGPSRRTLWLITTGMPERIIEFIDPPWDKTNAVLRIACLFSPCSYSIQPTLRRGSGGLC
jgi:hypothetical protein